MTTAFLFPGQATQHVGMGRVLYRRFAAARAVYQRASDVLARDVESLCFCGPEEVLRSTDNAQIAVFVTNAAAQAVLDTRGIQASATAGHSVGELNALVAAGSLDLDPALRAIERRGSLMAATNRPGAMAALTAIDIAVVEDLCAAERTRGATAVIALENSPSQVVISGEPGAIERIARQARDAGALRTQLLPVSHAFHSPLMAEAVDGWRAVVAELPLQDPIVPVALNATGRLADGAVEIRAALVAQLTQPVRWVQCVRAVVLAGSRHAFEAGDSRTLVGFCRSIDRSLRVRSLAEERTLAGLDRYDARSVPGRGRFARVVP